MDVLELDDWGLRRMNLPQRHNLIELLVDR